MTNHTWCHFFCSFTFDDELPWCLLFGGSCRYFIQLVSKVLYFKIIKDDWRITWKAPPDVQHCLDGAKLAHEKFDGSMEKLQATLAEVEKDLKVLSSKKKKVTTLINQYQDKLSKSQENVTITEGEIYTIEENNVMSNNEVEILAKLEEAIEKSRQKIISFKIFQLLDFFYLLKIFWFTH